MSKPKTIRCAVYTRKSSEEGLEQEYNSLHAQRDACEAYIKSQIGEGWTCLKTAYDDGGISGGTMERPGLKQLLADIAARRIDVVVVYKVDRLTRSLWDFAKIVEVFDTHAVSFVSVTQSFNTTSSMGRLTLNMLLSFAQFEREVTSERIRDKIAASKRKGMWMGGGVPLGYEAEGRTLKINEAEADTVRHIFARYLELKSVYRLREVLRGEGVKSKRSVFSTGRTRGGCDLDRGALFTLLSNTAYLGKVRHKDQVYEGLHPAIVDQETFEAVQVALARNRRRQGEGSASRASSPLMGKIFDENGGPMTPTFTSRPGGKVYRYYVSAALQQGRDASSDVRRLSAPVIEGLAAGLVGRLAPRGEGALIHLVVRPSSLQLTFSPSVTGDDLLAIVQQHLLPGERAGTGENDQIVVYHPARARTRGGSVVRLDSLTGPRNPEPNDILVGALRRGHLAASAFGEGGKPSVYDRRMAPLAFLAPDLQAELIAGKQRFDMTIERLLVVASRNSWVAQRETWIA